MDLVEIPTPNVWLEVEFILHTCCVVNYCITMYFVNTLLCFLIGNTPTIAPIETTYSLICKVGCNGIIQHVIEITRDEERHCMGVGTRDMHNQMGIVQIGLPGVKIQCHTLVYI